MLTSARTASSAAALATGHDVRMASRSGGFAGHTTGLAHGFVQGNLAILPRDWAEDFLRFCTANPKACPLLGVSDPGSPFVPALGADLDIRTDLPRYRVWRDGGIADEPTEIGAVWRDDLVAFVIGCSFTFEELLLQSGIALRHLDHGCNVSMYRTNIATRPAGRFHGPMVVSMRPFRPAEAIRAIQITSRLPGAHGAPVHIGHPASIGIADIGKPDYGDAVPVADDELPVFWACGVTPQAAIVAARVPFAITHAPGAMLVTDLKNTELVAF